MTASRPDRPVPIERIVQLMADFEAHWALCGGWAVDAWLGQETRGHQDLDLSVFHEDQQALFTCLVRDWNLVGHDPNVPDDTKEPWTGRQLDLPAHIHAHSEDGFELEVLLDDRSDDEWVLRREPRIALPLEGCVKESGWGLPTVVPEVLMFFKARRALDWTPRLRPHDEIDFFALLPLLERHRDEWLRNAIAALHPQHPWLARLHPEPADRPATIASL